MSILWNWDRWLLIEITAWVQEQGVRHGRPRKMQEFRRAGELSVSAMEVVFCSRRCAPLCGRLQLSAGKDRVIVQFMKEIMRHSGTIDAR